MPESLVSIRFALDGLSETLQGLQQVLDLLGGFSALSQGGPGAGGATNVFNPALSSAFAPTMDTQFQPQGGVNSQAAPVQAYPQPDAAAAYAQQSIQQQPTIGATVGGGSVGPVSILGPNGNPWAAPGAPGGTNAYGPYASAGAGPGGENNFAALSIGRVESITIGSVNHLNVSGANQAPSGGVAGYGGAGVGPAQIPGPSRVHWGSGYGGPAAQGIYGGSPDGAHELFAPGGGFYGGGGGGTIPPASGGSPGGAGGGYQSQNAGGGAQPGSMNNGGPAPAPPAGGGGAGGGGGAAPLGVPNLVNDLINFHWLNSLTGHRLGAGVSGFLAGVPGLEPAVSAFGRLAGTPLGGVMGAVAGAGLFASQGLMNAQNQGPGRGESQSSQDWWAAFFEPLGNIPVLGALAQPKIAGLRAEGAARDQAAILARLGGSASSEGWEQSFLQSGDPGARGFAGFGSPTFAPYRNIQSVEAGRLLGHIAAAPGMMVRPDLVWEAGRRLDSNQLRPAERERMAQMLGQGYAAAFSNPALAADFYRGSDPFATGAGQHYLGAAASMFGDLGAAQTAIQVDQGQYLGSPGAFMLRTAQQAGRLQGAGLSGLEATGSGILLGQQAATMQSLGARGATAARMQGQFQSQAAQLDAAISAATNDLSKANLPPDQRVTLQVGLEQLKNQRAQVGAQAASLPFQMAEAGLGFATGIGAGQSGLGGSLLSVAQFTGQTHFGEAFGRMEAGAATQIQGITAFIGQARRAGASEEQLRPFMLQQQALEVQLGAMPFQRGQMEFEAGQGVLGAGVASAGAGVGIALARGDLGGAVSASGGLISSLQQQRGGVAGYLGSLGSDVGEGVRAPLRAHLGQLDLQIQQAVAQRFQALQQELLLPAQASSQIAGAALGAAQSLGARGGELGAALSGQVQAAEGMSQATYAAWQQARQVYGTGSVQELQARGTFASAYQAARVAPVQAAEAQFQGDYRFRMAGAEMSSTGLELVTQYGGGPNDITNLARQGIGELVGAADEAGGYVSRLDRMHFGADTTKGREARIAHLRAQARVGQFGEELASLPLSVGVREQAAQAGYAADVLSIMPGGYGNLRGAYGQQMQASNQAVAELEQRRRTLEGTPAGTPQAMFALNQQIRQASLQGAQAFAQLSYGWENKVAGFMLGAPGNMDLDSRGVSMMDAVSGGVVNPHFGATRGQMPAFMRYASLAAMPSLAPGYLGPAQPGPNGGFGFYGAGDLAGTGAATRKGRKAFNPQAGGDPGEEKPQEIHIYIHTPDGQVQMHRMNAGDNTSQGITTGWGDHSRDLGHNPSPGQG